MQTNKTYTAADFQRYHSGTMPADEMHALEKASLDDPFLADALEGYTNTTNFDNDIEELKKRLDQKRNTKKVFTITSFTLNRWWRIAALFIIVGFIFYTLNYKNKDRSVAINEIQKLPKNADSFSKQNNKATKDTDNAKMETTILSNDANTARQDSTAFQTQQGRIFEKKMKQNKEAVISNSPPQPQNDFAYNNVAKADKKVSSNKPSAEIQLDSSRFASPQIKSKPLDEVVVTGYGTERKKDITGSVSSMATKEINQSTDNNAAFHQYLKDSTHTVFDHDNKQLSGEVMLSFKVSRKGHPQDISVVQSTCTPCEAEAIHLLKNGPAWKKTSSRLRSVLIKF